MDGTRLMLQSGEAGMDESVYSPEGDPYTKVVVHGNCGTTDSWFEVIGNDGVVHKFGSGKNSRLEYTSRSGERRVEAWYIDYSSNQYGDYVVYKYLMFNLYVRPDCVTYGHNDVKSRNITNRIEFHYSDIGATPITFSVGDQQGKITLRLMVVSTFTDLNVYRRYGFIYDITSDKGKAKYARLTQIDEMNGKNEKLAPVKLSWNYLPSSDIVLKTLDVSTDDANNSIKAKTKDFFAVDVNNDGISDIFRISNVQYSNFNSTYLYANISYKGKSGKVMYRQYRKQLENGGEYSNAKFVLGGIQSLDIEGDGYNDIIYPVYVNTKDFQGVRYTVLLGSSLAKGIFDPIYRVVPTVAANEAPLFTYFDTDGDGTDDIVCLEQTAKDGAYNASILNIDGRCHYYELKFPNNPQKIYNADFNSDGLTDIIVFYDGGYKIYFNKGGEKDALKFDEVHTQTGSNIGNCFRLEPGDFNGDGKTDFLYFVKYSDFNVAINNGDGTFTLKEKVFSLDDIDDNDTNKDNNRFTILLNDINRDGKTDVFVCKARYVYEGFPKFRYEYRRTYARWLLYDGKDFTVIKELVTNKEEDAEPGRLFMGDFDGDGAYEIANYGSNLWDEADKQKDILRVYTVDGDMARFGRVASITDGLGNATRISYKSASDPNVYTLGKYNRWNTNNYTLPLSLVSSVSKDNGSAGTQTSLYTYGGLKVNTMGKGLLGFTVMTTENKEMSTKEETVLSDWDENSAWLPLTKTVTRTVGDDKSFSVSKTKVVKVGNNYFSYVNEQDILDLDGNNVQVSSVYDTDKGVPMEETSSTEGGDMYKTVKYSGYIQKAGMWMPTMMERILKHKDDTKVFSVKTVYMYDDKGNVVSTIDRYGTSFPLKTVNTYDVYGNVLTSEQLGYGVGANVESNVYDNTGRFVVKSMASATSSVKTFTYDIWGNVLNENDETNPNNVLTITHVYDTWGDETAVIDQLCNTSTTETGWGNSVGQKYYVLQSPANGAWVKTWYDNAGNETSVESVGLNGISISKETKYNGKGQVESVVKHIGERSVTENYKYDVRGRLDETSSSTGRAVKYSYDNRTTTTTSNGRTYSKTVDAWGNVSRASDPVSSVVYHYSSNGNPARIESCGSCISMEYDDAGNRILLSDHDAGTTVYTYAADGRLLTQTDGRGVITVNRYDNAGRVVSSIVGKTEIVNTYGASGDSKNRLVRSAYGKNYVDYTYDRYGRVIVETRHVDDGDGIIFKYAYNGNGQLESKTYPGGLVVNYAYDNYGNRVQTDVDGKKVYSLDSYDGIAENSSFMGRLSFTTALDNNGFVKSMTLANGNDAIETLSLSYDAKTGNLMSRQLNDNVAEVFSYDNVDRLTGVKAEGKEEQIYSYGDNGNLTYKTGIGKCFYNIEGLPHAVSSVQDSTNIMPNTGYEINYNVLNKVDNIIRHNDERLSMSFTYGPDSQRWSSTIYNGLQRFGTIYAGDYERMKAGMTATREYFYIGNNILVVRVNGGDYKPYVVFTDNLGSVLSAYDEEGNSVFSATYDAWGQQNIKSNQIALRRGYCGHEMISEFNLINMNGRLYDPMTSRFLSPDNYVQLPDNSQSYNRYSYCLNNPLKYTDPSGELFGLDDALVLGFASGAFFGVMESCMNGGNMLKGAIIGAAKGLASYGIGAAFGHGVGSFGKEMLRAGSHGLASGVINAIDGGDFVSAAVSGAAVSGIGSYVQSVDIDPRLMVASTTIAGGTVAWLTGGEFLQGAIQGFLIGAFNHSQYEKFDPTGNRSVYKARERYKIKHDSKYRKKIISEIEKDGILTFDEAYYWYTYGDGSKIQVDASKLNLGRIDITGRNIGDKWPVQTLTFSGDYSVGLVYGNIIVEYKGNNKFYVRPDAYDFDIHTDRFWTWDTIKRNIETIGAKLLHGPGTPFDIVFNGFYYNK